MASRSTPTTPRRSRRASRDRAAESTTGLLHARRRGAGHGHEPAHLRAARHEHASNYGRNGRRATDLERRPARSVRAAATARQALLDMASTQLGVPVASLTVSKGVVVGRRQVSQVRPAHRREAVQRRRSPATAATRRRRRRSRCGSTSWSARGRAPGSTSRQGRRDATPTCTTSGSPACCTRRVVRPHGQGASAPRRTIPHASIRARSRTSRMSRSSSRATSSPSSRRRSTTRSRRPPS